MALPYLILNFENPITFFAPLHSFFYECHFCQFYQLFADPQLRHWLIHFPSMDPIKRLLIIYEYNIQSLHSVLITRSLSFFQMNSKCPKILSLYSFPQFFLEKLYIPTKYIFLSIQKVSETKILPIFKYFITYSIRFKTVQFNYRILSRITYFNTMLIFLLNTLLQVNCLSIIFKMYALSQWP